MNFDSFSHGQITAKLWLCEELEKHIPPESNVFILGGWHNVLGFMLQCRRPYYYKHITSIDVDASAVDIANKVTNAWSFDELHANVTNKVSNANDEIFDDNSAVYINTSGEHFENSNWFNNIPDGALVAIQSVDIVDANYPWLIKQPTPTFDSFLAKYPLTVTMFADTKRTQYNDWGYNRYMAIGYK